MLDSKIAIDLLIQCDGNLNLAIDKSRHTKEEFLSAVSESSSLQVLMERMKALALLRLFDMFNKAAVAAEAGLADMEPKDAAKNFSTLAAQLAMLATVKGADNISNTVNIADITLKMLPPEVRQAVLDLTNDKVKELTEKSQ